jgi:hypothetical protein
MTLTISDLKFLINNNLDPDDLLEFMEITTEELIEKFEYKLEEGKIYNRLSKMFSDGRG